MEQTARGRLHDLLEMIKFSHTIFALPFALTGMVLAAEGLPSFGVIFWVIVAMVGARTAAMTFNRIADWKIDAENPRTAERQLPSGKVTGGEAWLMLGVSVAALLFAAWMLNPLCLKLAPVALGALFLYPYTKRFTELCHYVLGICLAAAPLGAWIAVTGEFSWKILPLALAVIVWVAGFDVLYALQDLNYDREKGLHSLPVRLGVAGSLKLAKRLHYVMLALLALQMFIFGLGLWYFIGLSIVVYLILYEHSLVTPTDLTRMDAAFFTMNGVISVVVFIATFIDLSWN
jgi:4-hydroxybenzoate polyprenyltransferase